MRILYSIDCISNIYFGDLHFCGAWRPYSGNIVEWCCDLLSSLELRFNLQVSRLKLFCYTLYCTFGFGHCCTLYVVVLCYVLRVGLQTVNSAVTNVSTCGVNRMFGFEFVKLSCYVATKCVISECFNLLFIWGE